MKLIRFIDRGGMYTHVIESMVNPIAKYLPKDSYQIISEEFNNETKMWEHPMDENCCDVSFFSDVKQPHTLFLSHGIGDKCYRDTPSLKNFEFVGCSGRLWLDKYILQGMDRNRILIVGYPKLDPLFQNKVKIPNTTGKINVLYAPTHNVRPDNPNSTSSYPRLMSGLEKIYNDFNIKISTHPANQKSNDITFNNLLSCDVVISDSGSLVYEALALNIPVVMPDWLVKNNVFRYFPHSFEEQIYKEKIGYHANSIEHMRELIYQAYQEGLDDKTKTFIEGILPTELRGRSGEIIAEILMSIVKD